VTQAVQFRRLNLAEFAEQLGVQIPYGLRRQKAQRRHDPQLQDGNSQIVWAIYQCPPGAPQPFAAKAWICRPGEAPATGALCYAPDLESARQHLPEDFVRRTTREDARSNIVEVWEHEAYVQDEEDDVISAADKVRDWLDAQIVFGWVDRRERALIERLIDEID